MSLYVLQPSQHEKTHLELIIDVSTTRAVTLAALLDLEVTPRVERLRKAIEWNGYGELLDFVFFLGQHLGIKVRGPGWGSNPHPAIQK